MTYTFSTSFARRKYISDWMQLANPSADILILTQLTCRFCTVQRLLSDLSLFPLAIVRVLTCIYIMWSLCLLLPYLCYATIRFWKAFACRNDLLLGPVTVYFYWRDIFCFRHRFAQVKHIWTYASCHYVIDGYWLTAQYSQLATHLNFC